jgi:hypothetical protein
MKLSRKSGILTLIGFALFAWIELDRDGNANTHPTASNPEIECNYPHSLCAAEVGYPIGDGLVITLIEDFF